LKNFGWPSVNVDWSEIAVSMSGCLCVYILLLLLYLSFAQ